MYIPPFLRDPGAGGSGGGAAPGIMDLVSGAAGGPAKLDEVIQTDETEKAAQEALAKEATNDDGTLKDGYEKDANGKITKKEAAAAGGTDVEGLNADGTLQEGYIKDAAGNVVKDPEYKPEDGNEGEEGNFWEAVSKITGREFKIEYPEGVDPTTPEGQAWLTTPEGVAHVVNAERENAAIEFEKYLQTNNPRGYAFLMHLNAGGKEEDFFNDNRGYTLPTADALAASADLQSELYKYDLINLRGLDEDAAQALVEKAIKDNKLKERAETAWKVIDKAQKDQLKTLQDATEADNKKFETDLTNFTALVQKQIKDTLGFVVPETQQAEFQKYITDNVRYDNGKFFIVQELAADPKTQLESLFFQFKKGDLATLVKRQAKTQAAQGMRLKLGAGGKGPGTGGGTGKSKVEHLPLSAILPSTSGN